MRPRRLPAGAGFTLVELVVTITLTGIVAAMIGAFLKAPMSAYFDSVRRTRLTDEADTSLRFLARELHAALPNSISCGTGTVSFRPVQAGGRYREYPTAAGTGNALAFGTSLTTFDSLSSTSNASTTDAYGQAISSGTVVIGNLGAGVSSCDATQATPSNTLAVTALGASLTVQAATVPQACDLQTASASNANDRSGGRYYFAGSSVSYSCGASGLTRNGARMADRVSACQISCTGANAAVQTVSLSLTLTDSGESLTLFRQVHVENYP